MPDVAGVVHRDGIGCVIHLAQGRHIAATKLDLPLLPYLSVTVIIASRIRPK